MSVKRCWKRSEAFEEQWKKAKYQVVAGGGKKVRNFSIFTSVANDLRGIIAHFKESVPNSSKSLELMTFWNFQYILLHGKEQTITISANLEAK